MIFNKTKLMILPFVAGLVVATAFSMTAVAQTDNYTIENLGPHPELFRPEGIEMELRGWQWKSELSQRQQELIAKAALKWEAELKAAQERLSNVKTELAASRVAFPIDARSVQKIDDMIDQLKSELAGLTAQLKMVESETRTTEKELAFERESNEETILLLENKLRLVREEYDQNRQLVEAGTIQPTNILPLKAKVAEVETELQNAVRQLQLTKMRLQDTSGGLIVVVEQREAAKQQLQDLTGKRDSILKLDAIRAIEDCNSRIASAKRMIEMARIRQFELQLENTRNLALIELARERLDAYKIERASEEKSGASDK